MADKRDERKRVQRDWHSPDVIIKTNIVFDETKGKFVIECENLETLNHILNIITYAKEQLRKQDGKVNKRTS